MATPNRLTVLVDERESEGDPTPQQLGSVGRRDGGLSHRTPDTMMRSVFNLAKSPFGGSAAGSTTKSTLRTPGRSPQRLPRVGSAMLDSQGSLGNPPSMTPGRRNHSGGHGWRSGGRSMRTPFVLMLFLVTLVLGGSGVISSLWDTKWKASDGNDSENTYDDVSGGEGDDMLGDYHRMLASLPSWNEKRACTPYTKDETSNGVTDYFPDLIEIHAWKSRKEIEGNSISLVTQMSTERIPNLEDQCLSWPDRIVASIYVPMTANTSGGLPLLPGYSRTTLDDMIRGIDSFHKYMETIGVCALDVIFLGQFIKKPDFPGAYPVNALRNKALSFVQTELSIHVNSDFLVTPLLDSPGLGYRDEQIYEGLLSAAKKKTAFILPSLELSNIGQDLKIVRNVARSYALSGKSFVKEAIQKKLLGHYISPDDHEDAFRVDLKKWVRTKDHSLIKDGPPVSSMSEPCILLATEITPWFDERFVDNGCGANVWLKYLEKKKFKFRTHGTGFSMHLSHMRPVPKSRYLSHRREFRLEVMNFLNSTLSKNIDAGKFQPITRHCQQ